MMSFESFCDIYWRDRQHWYAVASADSGFGIMCTKKQGLKYPYLIRTTQRGYYYYLSNNVGTWTLL